MQSNSFLCFFQKVSEEGFNSEWSLFGIKKKKEKKIPPFLKTSNNKTWKTKPNDLKKQLIIFYHMRNYTYFWSKIEHFLVPMCLYFQVYLKY